MEIKDLIIALMAFAAIGVICFGFVSSLYSENGLNVDMNDNLQTKFDTMYTNVKTTRNSTDQFTAEFQTYAPGGSNASITEPDIDTGDLLRSSLRALTNVPTALALFSTMLTTVSSTLGIDSAIVGFILGSIVITIIIILVTAVLKWNQ